MDNWPYIVITIQYIYQILSINLPFSIYLQEFAAHVSSSLGLVYSSFESLATFFDILKVRPNFENGFTSSMGHPLTDPSKGWMNHMISPTIRIAD